MSLKNLLKTGLVSCQRGTSVREAAKMMDDRNVGAILVVENKKPVGIITDRDIVVRCISNGRDCTQQKVADIMTDSVETVSINDGLYDVVERMESSQVRRLPVVDENGFAVGLLSFGDVFELLAKELSKLAAPATPERKKLQNHAA